jgi:hypothetical protein
MLVKCRWNGLCKYNSSVLQFRNYKVNDLLKNKPKHYVAVFKESLIYDDVSDFFERSYSLRESILWLHRIINHRGYNNKEAYVSYRDYAVRRIMFKYTYKQIHVKYMKGKSACWQCRNLHNLCRIVPLPARSLFRVHLICD